MSGHCHLSSILHASSSTSDGFKAEEKKHKQGQHAADACALAAGAYALHKKHEAKKHLEQRHAHKVREHVAVAVAMGAGTLAHHKKQECKHAKEAAKKQHIKNKH
ncbi:hypothetical protein L7F22_004325 [Adiantum nelumboides]|nr:hypothetical protein [Adiantum nelumboides]